METRRLAICGDGGCGREWTLVKAPDEYSDGPRCPDCGTRNVEVESPEGAGESTATVAFRMMREDDATPLDLVTSGVVGDPDRAEALAEQFDRMSEYELLGPAGVEELRGEAFEEGVRAGRAEERERLLPKVETADLEGYEAGYEDGRRDAREEREAQEA